MKTPEVEGVQRRRLEGLGLIMILRISEIMAESNRKCIRFCFQEFEERWIRSAITNELLHGIDESLGVGRNYSIVGIQGEDQMGRLEWMWGIKQEPAYRRGKVVLIPFQIQNPDLRECDKKLSYLIYLVWNW